jgi:hypothetical protein
LPHNPVKDGLLHQHGKHQEQVFDENGQPIYVPHDYKPSPFITGLLNLVGAFLAKGMRTRKVNVR